MSKTDMNQTPMGERVHIGIFGRRNAGKSSLINAITGQNLAVVSPVKGTTTDPVKKAMELLPLGPVVFIDTPGLDDEGELGEARIKKAQQIMDQADCALLVVEAGQVEFEMEKQLLKTLREGQVPFLIVVNKTDLSPESDCEEERSRIAAASETALDDVAAVSASENTGIAELKSRMAQRFGKREDRPLIRDLLAEGDVVVLVVPIDSAAPKGRLILPQQQVIRDALEAGAIPVVARETQLKRALEQLVNPPALVVTDSQIFGKVSAEVPDNILLTSFSILMARYKGDLEVQAEGARAVEQLADGDAVLISEGCTHHRQCGDIGTVKLPAWIRAHTGKNLRFVFTSGGEFPKDLSEFSMVVHCGGCMLNGREMKRRIKEGETQGIPITNYGMLIAYLHGIFDRALEPFEKEKKM